MKWVSRREYYKHADGTVTCRRIGSSPFVWLNEGLFFDNPPDENGLIVIHGEMFRIVQKHGSTPDGFWCGVHLAMKESVVAQTLRWWYHAVLPFVASRVEKVEYPALTKMGFRDGDRLPWWSITRLLYRTLVCYE